jgi:hypothetical protein
MAPVVVLTKDGVITKNVGEFTILVGIFEAGIDGTERGVVEIEPLFGTGEAAGMDGFVADRLITSNTIAITAITALKIICQRALTIYF